MYVIESRTRGIKKQGFQDLVTGVETDYKRIDDCFYTALRTSQVVTSSSIIITMLYYKLQSCTQH